MYKLVDIQPQGPIYSLKVPITTPVIGVKMSDGDILRCIHTRAIVTEILSSGKRIKLDLTNYNKDNSYLDEIDEQHVEAKSVKLEQKEIIDPKQTQTDKNQQSIKNITKPEPKQPEKITKKQEVKTSEEDPKYFKEIEKQKNKIEK